MQIYDVIVIGGGPGGYVASIRAAQLGLRVLCIDRNQNLGGTCLNYGCIPSKTLLHASWQTYYAKNHLASFGVHFEAPRVDFTLMNQKKNKIIGTLGTGIKMLFTKHAVEYVQGEAILGKETSQDLLVVEVLNTSYRAKNLIIATGSQPIMPFDANIKNLYSSTQMLEIDRIMEGQDLNLGVIGGGYIGVEMASIYAALGCKVSIIEGADSILNTMDEDVVRVLEKSLKTLGVEIFNKTKVECMVNVDEQAVLINNKLRFDKVLVAMGRSPLGDVLGAKDFGVCYDELGYVQVDKNLRSAVKNIYAIGDAVPGPMLAHRAEKEGVFVAEILAGYEHIKPLDHLHIPAIVYTHPEVGTVGYQERQLRNMGYEYRVSKFNFMANSRANSVDQREGFVKLLTHPKSCKILGASVVGSQVEGMVAEINAIMSMHGTSQDLARICHAHPTFSEALKEAAMMDKNWSIHGG